MPCIPQEISSSIKSTTKRHSSVKYFLRKIGNLRRIRWRTGFIMQHSTFTVALRAINFKGSLKDRKSVSRQQSGRTRLCVLGVRALKMRAVNALCSRVRESASDPNAIFARWEITNHIMSLYCRIFNFTAFITREPGCRWADKQPTIAHNLYWKVCLPT